MEQTIATSKKGSGNRQTGDIGERPLLEAVLSSPAIVWEKVRAGIWSVETKLSSDVTLPLDVERISAHLGVVRRAEEEGNRDLPPSGEDVPTGTQREIIAYFSSLRRRARRQAANAAASLSGALDELQNSGSLAKLRDVPSGCENRILRLVADVETRLQNVVEEEQSEKLHYDKFRQKHGLHRVARYSGTAYRNFVIMPALIVAIASATAYMTGMFAGGNSAVSAVWIAAVSLAAVVVPFMLGGSVLRWINHVSGFNKLIGWVGGVIALVVIVAIAYYADFHIAAVLANPGASNRDVLDAMRAAPLDVVSVPANWKGFALVVMTGLLAMLLAYHSDDPYPGYGAVQRRYYRARDARDDLVARLRQRINGLIDRSEAEIDGIRKDFKSKVRTFTGLVEKAERIPSTLREYDAELEDACNIVLDRYRAANAAVRRSEPPLSFAEHVCFNPDGDTDTPQFVNGRDQVMELQTAVVELEKEADLARQKLRDLNVRMINSISEPQVVDGDLTI